MAQIPNPGFELWLINDPITIPVGWSTTDNGVESAVSQDFEPYEGNLAMRVDAIPIGVGSYGVAECPVPIDYIPASLDFYAKVGTEFGAVSVIIIFFNGENEVYTEFWNNTEPIENWTLVTIPLEQIEPVLTHAVIRVEAIVGDLAPGTAWISVDAFGFEGPLSNDPLHSDAQWNIYPNPAHNEITLEGVAANSAIRIRNLTGQTVYETASTRSLMKIDLRNLSSGMYLISMQSPDGTIKSRKLLVE